VRPPPPDGTALATILFAFRFLPFPLRGALFSSPGRARSTIPDHETRPAAGLAIAFLAWQTQRVLIGLFPELDAPGGVQRAGRHLAAVLTEFAASRAMDCRLLSLNDSQELHRMSVGNREFVFTGCARGKGRFTTTAMRTARRRAKLVLAAHPNLGPVLTAMKLVAPRLKTVICTHGIEVWEPLSRMRRYALRKADLILAPSRSTAEHTVEKQAVPAGKLRVLPWALDPQFEALLAARPLPAPPSDFPAGRVVMTVGRWEERERYKGMDTLISALPRLLPRWPDLQLVIAGGGDDREWLEHLTEKNGVRRHVHFFSGLSYAELSACYTACEIFALPSAAEGFGLVYLEAMAHGKPVIGGAHGGAPEVIEDGATGYLVQHGDTVQLATSIETLLAHPEVAKEMGARGRHRVEQDFRFNAFAKTFKKILREQCES
jgi:phosphatidyl-myo-inositol dimannoside synthase